MTREEINLVLDKLKLEAESMSQEELQELVADLDEAIRIVHYRIMEQAQDEQARRVMEEPSITQALAARKPRTRKKM